MEVDAPLPAGPFSSWLAAMEAALRGEQDADVPCGGCTACCTSSQFVHIGAEEVDVLAHVPAELLFPAPGLPAGNVLLGYDQDGRCPMLVDGACSIYEHRPRTCRTYDCRVFAAADVAVEVGDKPAIADRAARWRFEHPSALDEVEHAAVRAAARFVAERPAAATATGHAVLAVRTARRFLVQDPATGAVALTQPDPSALGD